MRILINKICNWNAARHKQEHDPILTTSLLIEEIEEFADASLQEDKVEQIDALVDIIYVAIGALWKLGLQPQQIFKAIDIVCISNDTKDIDKPKLGIKANRIKGINYIPPTERLTKLVRELK